MTELKDLKPGDEVAIVQSYPRVGTPRIVSIDRVTPTRILADGDRWNRHTGWIVGGARRGRPYHRITPATDEHRHTAERKRLWDIIIRAFTHPGSYETRNDLSTEAMRTIADALKADEVRRGERG